MWTFVFDQRKPFPNPMLCFLLHCRKLFQLQVAKLSTSIDWWSGVFLKDFFFFAMLKLEPLLINHLYFLIKVMLLQIQVMLLGDYLERKEGQEKMHFNVLCKHLPKLHVAKENCLLEKILSWKSKNMVWRGNTIVKMAFYFSWVCFYFAFF